MGDAQRNMGRPGHWSLLGAALALAACDDGALSVRDGGDADTVATGGQGGGGTAGGTDSPVGGRFDPLQGGHSGEGGTPPPGGDAGGGRPEGGQSGAGGESRPPPTNARAVTLVSFGCDEGSVRFGVEGWSTLLRDAEHVEWVSDPDPTRCGVADRPGTPGQRSFVGVRGSPDIDFGADKKLVATVFHRAGHNGERLRMRVSFTDPDAPEGAGDASPWYTMYVEAEGGAPRVGELGEIVFNLATADTAACETAPPSVGPHGLVNLSFDYPDSVPGQWVLTRLDLTNHVDQSPPTRPRDLQARLLAISPEAGRTAVELTWGKPTDPPGDNGGESGISRYFVYRDGAVYDLLSRAHTAHQGAELRWVDLGVRPGETHHYAVTALDSAITGRYPTLENLDSHRMGNESAPAEIDVTLPAREACAVLGPADLEYLGAFRAPQTDDWAYSGQALTFYPGGNRQPAGGEGAGSLYAVAHDRDMRVGELSIPEPILSRSPDALNEARVLRPAVQPWPPAYDGRWQPRGDVETRVGLAYHPGVGGVGEGLHYSIFMSYSGDQMAATHGMLSLDLTTAFGPWHAGGLPGTPEHVSFLYTGKFVAQIPQDWADANTGGRSVMVGLGWPISGHGYPSAGPTLGAIAPWEHGRLPERFEAVSHVGFLRYGGTGEEDRWSTGWTQSHFYLDAEWLEAGGARAVVFAATRPRGDEWYGGENGYDNFYCDADIPPHIGSATLRGPVDTDNVPVLFFYNPADFARVRAGEWAPHQPQPFAMLDLDDVLFSENDRFPRLKALAFDPGRHRLYAWENGASRFGHAVVHTWQVHAPTGCE